MTKNIFAPLTVALILFLNIGVTSCQNSSSKQKESTSTASKGGSVSVDEFEKQLVQSTNANIIDVRTPGEFVGGHLKNAVNININSADFKQKVETLDKNKPVFVYCLSGGRSSTAASYMRKQGFATVYEMSGGMLKWNNAGKPVETGNTAPKNDGISINEFNKQVNTDSYVLVDYNAKWCKPCIKMAPMLEKVATDKKDKLMLLKIDADENPSLIKLQNIQDIPVLVLYHKGKEVWRHNGLIDEATLLKETKL